MSKETLKKELKNANGSTREDLKKELKGTELSAKEKSLQVVYEELENIGKEAIAWDDSSVLDPKKEEELDKRFWAAERYLRANFDEEYLKKSPVQPGPLYKGVLDRREAERVENAVIEPVDMAGPMTPVEPLIPEADIQRFYWIKHNHIIQGDKDKRWSQDISMRMMQIENKERVELSPYTRRLQAMIKERTGR